MASINRISLDACVFYFFRALVFMNVLESLTMKPNALSAAMSTLFRCPMKVNLQLNITPKSVTVLLCESTTLFITFGCFEICVLLLYDMTVHFDIFKQSLFIDATSLRLK